MERTPTVHLCVCFQAVGNGESPQRVEQVLQNPPHLYLNCVCYVTDGRAFLCYIQGNNNSNRYNSNNRSNKPVCSLACLKKMGHSLNASGRPAVGGPGKGIMLWKPAAATQQNPASKIKYNKCRKWKSLSCSERVNMPLKFRL